MINLHYNVNKEPVILWTTCSILSFKWTGQISSPNWFKCWIGNIKLEFCFTSQMVSEFRPSYWTNLSELKKKNFNPPRNHQKTYGFRWFQGKWKLIYLKSLNIRSKIWTQALSSPCIKQESRIIVNCPGAFCSVNFPKTERFPRFSDTFLVSHRQGTLHEKYPYPVLSGPYFPTFGLNTEL